MKTPEIAIIGHPNEGKSSVLSTLAEDDSVRISSTPGETTECRTFPVIIDGKELLRFTDTPGFQYPQQILEALKTFSGNSEERLSQLREFTRSSPEFADDHELLRPVVRGAGIIYVVDGSRPVRSVDRAEMEILRLIGRPRMAVINCKDDNFEYLDDWKDEFRKRFNANRLFNAHRATYVERIELLESLKAIDQDWQSILSEIIESFKADWESRTRTCAEIICSLLKRCLTLQLTENISTGEDAGRKESVLVKKYSKRVMDMEAQAHQQIRALFKHNIFDYKLSKHSVLREDLFNEKTWQLLGLTRKQFMILGGLGGAAIGAGIDIAALGHGLGLFTALGGIAGTVGAIAGRNQIATDASFMGVKVAGPQILVGPAENISLLFVLLNRALLYYQQSINWAHGRRDYQESLTDAQNSDKAGFTRDWPAGNLKICHRFFKALRQGNGNNSYEQEKEMQSVLFTTLMKISNDQGSLP